MKDMSCSSVAFETFSASLRRGETLDASFDQAALPEYVRDFVRSTLSIALKGRLEEVAGSFFYGREDSIPNMFQALLDHWGLDQGKVPRLVHYLNHHIELDGEDHGPAAKKILSDLVRDDASRDRAIRTARMAISMRLHLWDGILRDLKAQDGSASEHAAKRGRPLEAPFNSATWREGGMSCSPLPVSIQQVRRAFKVSPSTRTS